MILLGCPCKLRPPGSRPAGEVTANTVSLPTNSTLAWETAPHFGSTTIPNPLAVLHCATETRQEQLTSVATRIDFKISDPKLHPNLKSYNMLAVLKLCNETVSTATRPNSEKIPPGDSLPSFPSDEYPPCYIADVLKVSTHLMFVKSYLHGGLKCMRFARSGYPGLCMKA